MFGGEASMATWGIAQAKAQLSEVVYDAEKKGPQILSRSGREVAVVVSMEEWKRMEVTKKPAALPPGESMADFLLNSPLHGVRLRLPKRKWKMRNPLL